MNYMSRIAGQIRAAPASAWIGLTIIIIYTIVAALAPLLAPFGEREVVGSEYQPWGGSHLLGTDSLGRDMFSRLIYGVRNTFGIALVATVITFVVGSVLGVIAALIGGWTDQVLSRLVDILMAIPALIFKLLVLTIFGTSLASLVLIIALIDSTRVFRLTRAVAMNIVATDFIEVAKLRGDPVWRLVSREILPNAAVPLIAEFGLRFCFVFLAVSALSFLGLGIQPPTADLGSMVKENASLIAFGDITPLLPAGVIALFTIGLIDNFIIHDITRA